MTKKEWVDIFAERLERIMKVKGFTQSELAERIRISQSTISKYLKGEQVPTVKAIVNMSYTFDMKIADLIDFGERVQE